MTKPPIARCRASLVTEGEIYGCILDAGHPLNTEEERVEGNIQLDELKTHHGVSLKKVPAQWLDEAEGAVPHRDAPERANRVGESQPLPIGNDEESSHAIGMALLNKRLQVGVARYGQPLQPGNGRDSLLDAIEEAADMLVYMITEWRERHPDEEFPLR